MKLKFKALITLINRKIDFKCTITLNFKEKIANHGFQRTLVTIWWLCQSALYFARLTWANFFSKFLAYQCPNYQSSFLEPNHLRMGYGKHDDHKTKLNQNIENSLLSCSIVMTV